MGFKTDGTSHRLGINGEKLTQQIISPRTTETFGSPKIVELRGGTQFKEDLFIPSTGQKISCKNRQSKGGTYDYMNSSKIFSELSQQNSEASSLRNYISGVKGSMLETEFEKGSQEVLSAKEECRAEIKKRVIRVLNSLSSEEIGALVKQGVSEYYSDDNFYFTITHVPSGNLRLFPAKALPLFDYLSGEQRQLFTLKGKSASRTVLFGEQKLDFGIRLRVGLNNGVGALLGGKKLSSNPTSSLVVKIQQDSPDKQFDSIDDGLTEVIEFE